MCDQTYLWALDACLAYDLARVLPQIRHGGYTQPDTRARSRIAVWQWVCTRPIREP